MQTGSLPALIQTKREALPPTAVTSDSSDLLIVLFSLLVTASVTEGVK